MVGGADQRRAHLGEGIFRRPLRLESWHRDLERVKVRVAAVVLRVRRGLSAVPGPCIDLQEGAEVVLERQLAFRLQLRQLDLVLHVTLQVFQALQLLTNFAQVWQGPAPATPATPAERLRPIVSGDSDSSGGGGGAAAVLLEADERSGKGTDRQLILHVRVELSQLVAQLL